MAAEESATNAYINSSEHSSNSSPQRVEIDSDGSKEPSINRNQPKGDAFFEGLKKIIDIDLSTEEIETSPEDPKEREKEKASADDSEESTEDKTSSSDSEESTEDETSSSDSKESTEDETSSSDSEEEIIAADSDEIGRENSISDAPKEQKDRDNTLYSTLAVQAGLFSAFQIRAILYDSISGPLSKPIHIIAKQSQPFLLAPAVVTVGIEIGCRVKNLIHAPEDHVQMAREGLTTSIIKAITVGAFCLNALYEQIGKPDPSIAEASLLLFAALILIEMFISAKSSAALPSTYYLSITFFVDFFVKLFLSPSPIMQLSSDKTIALIGYVMAMIGFAAVMGNVLTAKRHLNSENSNTVSGHSPLQRRLPDEESGTIPPSTDNSINSESTSFRLSTSNQSRWNEQKSVASAASEASSLLPPKPTPANEKNGIASTPTPNSQLSASPQTFWGEFCKRARNVWPYLSGDDLPDDLSDDLSTAPRPRE